MILVTTPATNAIANTIDDSFASSAMNKITNTITNAMTDPITNTNMLSIEDPASASWSMKSVANPAASDSTTPTTMTPTTAITMMTADTNLAATDSNTPIALGSESILAARHGPFDLCHAARDIQGEREAMRIPLNHTGEIEGIPTDTPGLPAAYSAASPGMLARGPVCIDLGFRIMVDGGPHEIMETYGASGLAWVPSGQNGRHGPPKNTFDVGIVRRTGMDGNVSVGANEQIDEEWSGQSLVPTTEMRLEQVCLRVGLHRLVQPVTAS